MARKLSYDQDKVKELRMKTIELSLAILNDDPKVDKWSQLKKDLILKLSPRILPQVQEISGPEGKPIPLLNIPNVLSNNSVKEDSEVKQED